MKVFQPFFIAGPSLFATSQAYVVEMYGTKDCSGDSTSRNVYDNTCAYVDGFQSFKLTTEGGTMQQLSAYSRQACAGEITFHACADAEDGLALGVCHQATNSNGGSNALSSYDSSGLGGDCTG